MFRSDPAQPAQVGGVYYSKSRLAIVNPMISVGISGAIERIKMPPPRMKKNMKFVFISDMYLDTRMYLSPSTVPNSPGIEIKAPITSADEMPFSFRTNGEALWVRRRTAPGV